MRCIIGCIFNKNAIEQYSINFIVLLLRIIKYQIMNCDNRLSQKDRECILGYCNDGRLYRLVLDI